MAILNIGLVLPQVHAANRTWSGAGTGAYWNTAANWGGTAPAVNDNLIFSGSTQQNNTNNISNLGVGFVTFNNGGFTLNGNTFTNVGSANAFFTNSAGLNTVACPLIMTAPGGRYWFIAPNTELRLTGVITNTAGSGTSVGWLNLTNGGTVRIMSAAKSTRGMDLFQGTVIVDGGLVDANSDGIRFKPPTGYTVAVQITNNGTLRIGGTGNLRMGNGGTGIGAPAGASSTSRLDISSGTLELYGPSVAILCPDSVAGLTALFNQNGGLVWGSGGANTLSFGNTTTPTGIYNLNGGILWISQVKQVNAGANVFNFNGGTLKPTGSSSAFFQGVDTAAVQSGGAVVDTTNFNVTIAQNLAAGSPSGGLTKLGTGALTLSGACTYTGSTVVSNGTLIVTTTSLAGGGSLAVADGAALTVTNQGSSLACSSLTMGAAAATSLQFAFPLGNPGAASIVAGNLNGNGYVTVNITGSGLTAGTFDLVDFTSGAGLANFHLGSVPPGVSAALVTTSTSLQLNITGVVKGLQWASAPADREWNTTSFNWQDLGNGNILTNYAQIGGFGDMVTFDSSATTAIDLPLVVTPVSITFDGNASSYAFTGAGRISGVGSLLMNGLQAVTLGTSNDFTGGTIVNAGAIYAGADQALGSGPVTLNSGTLASDSAFVRTLSNSITQNANTGVIFGSTVNPGPLILAGRLDLGGGTARTLDFNSDVIITGSLTNGGFSTKTGPGALIIRGNSLESALAAQQQGDVFVDGATFTTADGWRMENTIPSSTLHLIITNGGVFHAAAFVTTGNLRVGLSGGDNTASNILDIVSGTVDLTPTNGIVSGNSAVNVGGSGADDVVYLRSGGLLVTRELYGSAPSGTSDAHFMGGTMRPITNDTAFIQGLTNAFMEDGGLTIDTTNFSVTVPQALVASGAGGLTKIGAGTLTLTGTDTYVGPTVVNAGKLVLGPAYASPGNVTVNANSTLAFLQSSAPATVNLPSVTIGGGANSALEADLTVSNAPVAIITNLILNGSTAVNVSSSFGNGQFPLFGYGTISGPGSLVPGAFPQGAIAHLVTNVPNQTIDLVISGSVALTWTGTNGVSPNLWDVNVTTNWLLNGLPAAYLEPVAPGDAVTFNDSGSGSVQLNTTVNPASVTISDAAVSYTIQGSGQINAQGGLTKIGAAAVTLNVPGIYGGSTVISNGTFSFGANQTLANLSGNAPVAISTGTPTLTLSNSLNTSFAGNVSGATLTKTGNGMLTMTGSNTLSGNLFVSAGSVTINSGFMTANSYCSIGHSGTDNGTLTLKGTANFTGNNDFNLGDIGSSAGTINIQDTVSLAVNSLYVGSANATSSTASGTVNQTGGTVTELNSAAGTLCIGGRTSAGGVGIYNLSGGTFTATARLRVGSVGVGTLNQSGGTVIANGAVNIAAIAGSTGTYNLDGGTLMTTSVGSGTGANATFNLNGGVLLPLTNNVGFVTNLSQINVRNGGAVVDTTNFSVTIVSTLQHSSISGDNAVDGGLTKRGNGTLSLTGAGSTYTGPTVVMGGALNLAAGSVSSLNNLTLNNAALDLALNGGTTSFAATSLTLAGNSTLNLSYGIISGLPTAAINSSGSLIASGTTVINLNGYGFTAGQQFPLVAYVGTPLATLNNFSLVGLPYGVTANLSNNVASSSIDLVITAVVAPTTWIPLLASDALGSSSFNSSGNWQGGNSPAGGNGYYTAFTLRSPADTNAYTFGGSVLAVDAGGRFLLKGTNGQAMTVPSLVMSGGVVDFANSTSDNFIESLAGSLELVGGTTNDLGALASATTAEILFVNAPISGAGDLQINGVNGDTGVVVLAATNSYTGTTTVAAGTLLVNGANGPSAVVVAASAALGGTGSIGYTVNEQAGATLEPGIPANGVLTNTIGTLKAGGAASISGAVVMKINRAAAPTSDEFVAPGISVNSGATLTVTNLGSTNFVAGDTFTLFSTPIIGAFSTVALPALSGTNLFWTNNLAVNGSLAVAAVFTVNSTRTNLLAAVAGSTLTLSWPADHLGWHLQVQTNSASSGLGTNWVTIPGSDSVISTNLTINPANGSVFYRMVYP